MFLEELTHVVVEEGHDASTIAVPDTVQAVLSARIDRLPSEVKRLLVIAAVIGPEAPLSLLKTVSALPEAEIDLHLRHLQTAEFLYRTGYGDDAVVVFKHVLTQEVAYQSLLTRDRQNLHQRIARAWVDLFPDRVGRQPERVASHYTEAGLAIQAVTYWQLAGQQANSRSAYVEAITHLQTGLTVLATLPETPENVRHELSLQLELASALVVTEGYTAPSVVRSYARVYELCRQVDDHTDLFPILLQLARFDSQRGALQRSRTLGEQLLAIAICQKDDHRLQQAQWILGQTLHYLGEIGPACSHLTESMRVGTRPPLESQLGRDQAGVQIASLFFVSLDLWALGCPEEALMRSREALALAEALEHPFTLALAHYGMALLHQLRREPQAVLEQAHALLDLARNHTFSPYLARGNVLQGWAFVHQGEVEAGIHQMQRWLKGNRHEIDEAVRMTLLTLLADACCFGQRHESGLTALTDALATVENTGFRFHVAELYRLQGELALQQDVPDEDQAETYFQRALEAANRQQAKSWALRAAVSLSRLWQMQGRGAMAHELLANSYGGFTEGFDTPDLKEAKALLETLAH